MATTTLEGREQPLISVNTDLSNEMFTGKPKRGASLASVTFVLLNTILGAGILGLPGAYASSGFVGGTLLLIICCHLSAFGVHLLVEVGDRTGRPASFYSVAMACGGAGAGVLIDVLVAVNAFGVATSYLIVVGDVLPEVADAFGATGMLANRAFWMPLALVIGAPLSYLRNVSSLQYVSYAAFAMVMYIVVVIALFALLPATFQPCEGAKGHTASSPEDCRGDLVMLTEPLPTMSVLPIYIFAFTCHQNALSVTNEMHRPTRARVWVAAMGACLLGLGLYLIAGLGGYDTFGSNVTSDILKAYPEAATLPKIARLAIAFVVTMCYPMQVHPGRSSLISLITKMAPSLREHSEGRAMLVGATTVFIVGSIATALVVTSLGVVLTLIGTVCSTSIQFILPGACYFLLFPNSLKRWLALCQLLLGLVIVPLCLTLTLSPNLK